MHRTLLPLDMLVGLFALSALILGISPSYDPALSYPVQIGVLVAVIVYFVLAHGVANWQAAYLLGRGLLLAGTVFSAAVILQYGYQNWGETPRLIERAGEITTLLPNLGIALPHPNAVATFVETMIPLGIVLIFTTQRRNLTALWLVCTLICAYALVLTFSRGAFVGLGVTLVAAGLLLARRWPLRVAAVLLLAAGVAGLFLTSAGSDWALSRWTLYRNSLFVASDYLYTGIGLGDTFPLIYSRYGLLIQVPQLTYAHNLPLSVWMGQGLPGLLSFVALVVALYLFVLRVIRLQPRRLFHAAWLGVTANLVHGLFDSRQYVEALWLMPHLLGLIGLTAGLGRLALENARGEQYVRRVRYIPWRLALLGVVVLLAGVVFFNRELWAAWYTNRGALLEARTELNPTFNNAQRSTGYNEALNFYHLALSIDPQWPNANRRAGNLYVKMGQYHEAAAPLETAVLYEPGNPAAIKGLGLAYTWAGRSADAARAFHLLDDPQEMANELTVWGYYWSHDGEQPMLAAYAYETAAAMYPEAVMPAVWQAAADAYYAAGHPGKAREWYERVLRYEPDDQQVAQILAEINGG